MTAIVILGATSAIAQAVARRLTDPYSRFFLVARNESRLDAVAQDLRTRGAAAVHCLPADLTDSDRQGQLIDAAVTALQSIDVVLIAHGTLPEQSRLQREPESLRLCLEDNAFSTIALAELLGGRLAQQGSGSLVVLSSVAGDRGRQTADRRPGTGDRRRPNIRLDLTLCNWATVVGQTKFGQAQCNWATFGCPPGRV